MKIAVLGTGMVGVTIASKLNTLGHEVWLGSRSASNEKGLEWKNQQENKDHAHVDTFAEASKQAELVFNCTLGAASLDALKLAGADNLADKILIDVANPLDFSQGMPPSLTVCNTTSLAEQIQEAFPKTKVVKALNTVAAPVMVGPGAINGDHAIFISGNDDDAKKFVEGNVLKEWFGWRQVLDLGDITTARGTEMYLALWVRMWGVIGDPMFNIAVVRKQ